MPPKKQVSIKKSVSAKKRPLKKTMVSVEPISAPQKQPIVPQVPKQPLIVQEHHTHLKQAVVISAAFMVLFTSFLFISTKMKAQEYSASVMAVVAPTPLNTKQQSRPTWWDGVDPYTKLYAGTGAVGVMVIGLGALVLVPKKKNSA